MAADAGTISNLSPGSPFSAPVGAYMLHLLREIAYPDCTVGKLYIDGVWRWFTLEDAVRKGPKIPGETAIPAGCYQVVMSYSQRFQRPLPELLKVPHFTGIRIHPANTALQVRGCVGVGGGFVVHCNMSDAYRRRWKPCHD